MLFTSQSSTFTPAKTLHHLALLLSLQPLLTTLTHAIPLSSTSLSTPTLTRRYATGWCGVHVVQYQKNEPGVNPSPNYALDIIIYDANQAEIGRVNHADAPGGQGVGVTSQLPYVLSVTTGNVDQDAVSFAYADQSWASADQAHHCNFGAYDSGRRQGDCGFTC